MNMNPFKWRFLRQYGWLLAISSAVLVILITMGGILQNASQFAESYTSLLILSFAGLTILVGFLIKTLLRLHLQHKAQQPGIRLTLKLVGIITLVVGVPVAIIYYFALSFIHQGIDQWFDVKTNQALNSAVALVKRTQDEQIRNELNLVIQIAKDQAENLNRDPISTINQIRTQTQSQEASVYTKNGQLLAYSSQFAVDILPDQPSASLFQQVRQQKTYAAIESTPGTEMSHQVIRLLVPARDPVKGNEFLLQVIIPISDKLTQLATEVKIASGQYQELSYLKTPLKTSFTLILSLVLLLTLVTAILFTVQAIQNMVRPIKTLAKGTQAVRDGDYSVSMPIESQDEFGQLMDSFNSMTQQVAKARNDIKYSHQQAEIQKLYLQAIIKSLKSAVITFNSKRNFKTINDSANEILNYDLYKQLGKPLKEVMSKEDARHLEILFTQIFKLFEASSSWNEQIEFDCKQGQKILLIHGSMLPSLDQETGGYVIVIEDITQIVKAQLHAAWSDVAQRLAHEIKNPLTPIQLSAERLNYKLHSKLEKSEQDLLHRMTHTITEQVDAMKNLVQAFTEYADTPEINKRNLNINDLIQDVTGMYQDPNANWYVTSELDESNPMINADSAKLRQLFHNLIKNALEACENQVDTLITISTLWQTNQLQIRVCDNGPGLPQETKNWIFEPYATDKPKGTGLGLAIVKKIVDEHNGQIVVESTPNQGTCFIINLNA